MINVQTVRNKRKQEELFANLSRNRISMLGITDHKIISEDLVGCDEKGNVTFIITSAGENGNNATVGCL